MRDSYLSKSLERASKLSREPRKLSRDLLKLEGASKVSFLLNGL